MDHIGFGPGWTHWALGAHLGFWGYQPQLFTIFEMPITRPTKAQIQNFENAYCRTHIGLFDGEKIF